MAFRKVDECYLKLSEMYSEKYISRLRFCVRLAETDTTSCSC